MPSVVLRDCFLLYATLCRLSMKQLLAVVVVVIFPSSSKSHITFGYATELRNFPSLAREGTMIIATAAAVVVIVTLYSR